MTGVRDLDDGSAQPALACSILQSATYAASTTAQLGLACSTTVRGRRERTSATAATAG